MITLGYLTSPDAEITQPLVDEDPERGFNAFWVYTSLYYEVFAIVGETRVVLRQKEEPHKLMAFEGPTHEMRRIVERANQKLLATT